MDQNNCITRTEGLREVWDKIAQNEDKEVQRIVQSLKTSITEVSFADAFNQLNYGIPEKEVAVDDQWQTTVSLDIPVCGKTDVVWNNQLQSVQEEKGRKYFVIKSNSSMIIEQNDAEVSNELTAEYDLETGLNRKISNYSKVTIEQDIEMNDDVQTIKSVALIRGTQTIVPN